MTESRLTNTQLAILRKLSDGQSHTWQTLCECIPDELSTKAALWNHLNAIRKHLRGRGEGILCEVANRRHVYRHIRFLASAGDGRT